MSEGRDSVRAAAGESALSSGRREERPNVREGAGERHRLLRERCLRHGAPRARLHRGPDSVCPQGRGRAADGEGTGIPGQGDAESAAAVRGHSGRREGVRQDRSDREPAQDRRSAADRRRDGVHVPARAGEADRKIAGGRGQDSAGERDSGESWSEAGAAGGSRGGGEDRGRRAVRSRPDDSRRDDRGGHRAEHDRPI